MELVTQIVGSINRIIKLNCQQLQQLLLTQRCVMHPARWDPTMEMMRPERVLVGKEGQAMPTMPFAVYNRDYIIHHAARSGRSTTH